MSETVLQLNDVVKHFPVRGGMWNRVISKVHAVNGVTLSVRRGETLGIVGESGCGKSTLGKCIVQLHRATSGEVIYEGADLTQLDHAELMPYRRKVQMIFQDPYSSLNPRMTVRQLLSEVIRFHSIVPRAEEDPFIIELIQKVGLRADSADKFPHEFSGGQRQRIGIARALAVKPEFLVADEPVSALDVSIQAQVLNLLMDLREELGLTLIFISHDLKVVEHFCDRVAVLYLGNVVEELSCDDLAGTAKHPYTRALLGANPINDPRERRELAVLEGDVPSPYDPPPGCPFTTRCAYVTDECHTQMPPLVEHDDGSKVACYNL